MQTKDVSISGDGIVSLNSVALGCDQLDLGREREGGRERGMEGERERGREGEREHMNKHQNS